MSNVAHVISDTLSNLKTQADSDTGGVLANGDEVRITGKKRDDLQSMIELLKTSDIKIPLQFQNFRD